MFFKPNSASHWPMSLIERNLTQERLGQLVGVQKAQISKIENSVKNARFETILKVFEALGARVSFRVEMV